MGEAVGALLELAVGEGALARAQGGRPSVRRACAATRACTGSSGGGSRPVPLVDERVPLRGREEGQARERALGVGDRAREQGLVVAGEADDRRLVEEVGVVEDLERERRPRLDEHRDA